MYTFCLYVGVCSSVQPFSNVLNALISVLSRWFRKMCALKHHVRIQSQDLTIAKNSLCRCLRTTAHDCERRLPTIANDGQCMSHAYTINGYMQCNNKNATTVTSTNATNEMQQMNVVMTHCTWARVHPFTGSVGLANIFFTGFACPILIWARDESIGS